MHTDTQTDAAKNNTLLRPFAGVQGNNIVHVAS